MAICRIIETGATPEQYDRVRSQLGLEDSVPPGATLHIAARGDDGKIRIVEVWDSREQAEQFGEQVAAAREAVGVQLDREPEIDYFEVHRQTQA